MNIMFKVFAVLTWTATVILSFYYGNEYGFLVMIIVAVGGFYSGMLNFAIGKIFENQQSIANLIYKINSADTHSAEASKIIQNADIIYNEDGSKWRCPQCGNLNYSSNHQCKSCNFTRR